MLLASGLIVCIQVSTGFALMVNVEIELVSGTCADDAGWDDDSHDEGDDGDAYDYDGNDDDDDDNHDHEEAEEDYDE